jgi:hypothetical protein
MNLKGLSLLLATALPSVLALKKYSEKSDYYNQKIKTIWDSFSKENIEELKLTDVQKTQMKRKLHEAKEQVEEDIYSLLNDEQRRLFDQLSSKHRTQVVMDEVDGDFDRNTTIVDKPESKKTSAPKAAKPRAAKPAVKPDAKPAAKPAAKKATPKKPKIDKDNKPSV